MRLSCPLGSRKLRLDRPAGRNFCKNEPNFIAENSHFRLKNEPNTKPIPVKATAKMPIYPLKIAGLLGARLMLGMTG
jgi:hypothetical protein